MDKPVTDEQIAAVTRIMGEPGDYIHKQFMAPLIARIKLADALEIAVSNAIASSAYWMNTDELRSLIDNLDWTRDAYYKARKGSDE